MSIKLVYLDLDGTMIGHEGHVREEVWQAVDDARGAGLTLAVCTGRPAMGVAGGIARRLGLEAPHIFHNGAMVGHPEGAMERMQWAMSHQSLEALVGHARKTGVTLEFYTASRVYAENVGWRCRHHAEVLEIEVEEADLLEVARAHDVLKAHWIMAHDQCELALSLRREDFRVGMATSPVLPESVFASITHVAASKGVAARKGAEHLGVAMAEVMAVGDSPADLPVLEVAGVGVVMADAPQDLRDRFRVVRGVAEDGVAEALRLAIAQSGRRE